MNLNINLKPEYIFNAFGFQISNTFFISILVSFILIIISISFYIQKNKRNIFTQSIKAIIFKLLKLSDSISEDREFSKKILPLIATFFFFILIANILALLPGFLGSLFIENSNGQIALLRSPNSELNTTLALAIIAVFSIQYFSFNILGWKNYLKRFINFTSPIKFLLGIFEILSESVKILSFSFRLFGNIFAGEILLLVISFLIPYILPLPFMILELFVGTIQAFIFAILTLSFIKTSSIKK